MKRTLTLACLLWLPAMADADVWDVQTQNDNTMASTKNELVHGSDQLHDLGLLAGGGIDEDWYQIRQAPYSSYEVVVDGTSGDVVQGLDVARYENATSTYQASVAVGNGPSRALRFANTTAVPVSADFVRVKTSSACGTNCGADDVYRIRAYDSTLAISRFNNNGTQVTVLILQNITPDTIPATVYFWASTGTLAATQPFSLAPKSVSIFQTQTVVPGQSGAMTIVHTAGYGRLAGKSVALEPATGYSFDTPMTAIPH